MQPCYFENVASVFVLKDLMLYYKMKHFSILLGKCLFPLVIIINLYYVYNKWYDNIFDYP